MLNLLKRKKRVFLDTNILLLPGEGFDIFSAIECKLQDSFEFVIVKGTLDELEKLMTEAKKGSQKQNAKLGFIMAKQMNIKTLSSVHSHVDDAIIEHVKPGEYVATLDKGLQKRAKEKGCKVIVKRGSKTIDIQES